GVAPPPFPTPEDKLPLPQLKLPKGFKIEVYASGIANARTLRLGDKGTVFVSNRLLDKVYAIVERGGKRELKVIASRLDQPNGLALHNGALYAAQCTKIPRSERMEDNLDNPPKAEVNRVTKPGQHFGFPYCHNGTPTDREMGWGRSCDEFEPPAALLGPHSAVLGMRFYTGRMFPGQYRNAIFVARHGSWNRT